MSTGPAFKFTLTTDTEKDSAKRNAILDRNKERDLPELINAKSDKQKDMANEMRDFWFTILNDNIVSLSDQLSTITEDQLIDCKSTLKKFADTYCKAMRINEVKWWCDTVDIKKQTKELRDKIIDFITIFENYDPSEEKKVVEKKTMSFADIAKLKDIL